MKKINIAVVAVCLALAGYVTTAAAAFRHAAGDNEPGPAFAPRLLAAALVLFAAVLAGQTLFAKTAADRPDPPGAGRFLPPMTGMAVLFAYILVLEQLGFIVASALLAAAFLLACGVRKWYVLACYPVASSLAIYYIFRKLLIVFLPEGVFHF
ncbi:MAG: tripartite tricarboxylate transporter TctB family protein [Planctomycetota bacterium]|jgi:putative tricarboxylic transport membrane protein|nr:tripartite tricarboxylate transporter TctB family protein [Planctomycetota bacterium]